MDIDADQRSAMQDTGDSPSILGLPSPDDTSVYDGIYAEIDSDEEDLEQVCARD